MEQTVIKARLKSSDDCWEGWYDGYEGEAHPEQYEHMLPWFDKTGESERKLLIAHYLTFRGSKYFEQNLY